MHVSRWLATGILGTWCGVAVAAQQSPPAPATPAETAVKEGERKTSTDPAVNPDAAAMREFQARVDKYLDLHRQMAKGVAKPKDKATPAEIAATKSALSAKIMAARSDAKHGDIFAPDVRVAFRRLLAPKLKGEDGRDAKTVLKDDAPEPGSVPFKVNARYPEDQPLPSVPANLLLTLPTLEAPLEYRVVGRHLLLLDTTADLVVDYILTAIPE